MKIAIDAIFTIVKTAFPDLWKWFKKWIRSEGKQKLERNLENETDSQASKRIDDLL